MGSKLSHKRFWPAALVCLLAAAAILLACLATASVRQYHTAAMMLSAVAGTENEQAVMHALKAGGDAGAGSALMQAYGYAPASFWARGTGPLALAVCLLCFVCLWALWAQNRALKRDAAARIAELTAYLGRVNSGTDEVLAATGEDDFSHLEDEIHKTVAELRQTRENALREKQYLADTLADIAHQIKTPITSMGFMAELLEGSVPPDALPFVQKLQAGTARLERMVSALLTLAKLDAGALPLARTQVRAHALLLAAAEPVEGLFRARRVTLHLPGEDNTAAFTGDFGWSAEALLNILKNCAEHTPPGGSVAVTAVQTPLFTRIVIEDTGPGFAKGEETDIFRRFYKGAASAEGSVGIGLAMASAIIAGQNGDVRAENRPGGGARFTIKFYAR